MFKLGFSHAISLSLPLSLGYQAGWPNLASIQIDEGCMIPTRTLARWSDRMYYIHAIPTHTHTQNTHNVHRTHTFILFNCNGKVIQNTKNLCVHCTCPLHHNVVFFFWRILMITNRQKAQPTMELAMFVQCTQHAFSKTYKNYLLWVYTLSSRRISCLSSEQSNRNWK